MKKSGLLLSLLAMAFLSFSQTKKIKIGVQAGANLATINAKISYASMGSNYTSKLPYRYITGFTGGVQAEIHLAKNIYLQPEFSYSQLGAKTVYSTADTLGSPAQLTIKGTLHYLVLPVLVKYKLGNTGVGIYLGPQYGYLVGVTNKVNSTTLDDKDNSNYKSDVSGIFGAEYYTTLGLGISARYQLGMSNIQKAESIDASSFPPDVAPKSISVRNSAFTLTVGYRF